jgi:hypothetical protein
MALAKLLASSQAMPSRRNRAAGFFDAIEPSFCHCRVTAAVFSQIALVHWQGLPGRLSFHPSGRGAAGI